MKRLLLVSMMMLFCAGCAATVDEQVQRIRSEITAEIEAAKAESKRELAASQESLRADFKKELDAHKEQNQKTEKDVNLTLIDIQKDFFQNRRVTEDNARRVYILESLVAATRTASEEKAEGEIVLLDGSNVTTTLGTKQGIKAGDRLAVYKDVSSQEKLATIRVMVAEATQSKCEIVDQASGLGRGNVVKLIK